ncbi:MAG: IS4 family transposase [Lamprobacter sp.]|uniref:IS4 family transposase n=1 Tax=Lamprobacter sp. TaxID=3100796 RepID=UPI002B25E3CD|nr:IS4 family transposase [Lamprobacter sp.]MEA3643366.1 IS4 family transposase [Lamprobacter sp.]
MKRTNDVTLSTEEAQHVSCMTSVYEQLRQALFSPAWIERFRLNEKAFTRTRDLPFHRLVTWLLNLRKGSTEQELEGFFATLEEQPEASATPTPTAVCKARKRLSAKVFAALNRQAIETFRAGCATPLWHGFRLRAVDGTTLRLPNTPALERAFGAQPSGPMLARASMLYDLGHELVADFQLAAYCVSERELAIAHLEAAHPEDLLLYDRGYPAFWLMVMHLQRGVEFCMRLPREHFSAAEPFWNSDATSTLITLTPSAEQARDCRQQGLPTDPIRVRLVRVRLPEGETEVLATSVLEEERLPARLFKALYHRRWGAEESDKRQKRWVEIENVSGRSVLAVQQDVHAKILALNLASMVRVIAQLIASRGYAARKHRYQVRWTSTLSAMKNTLVRLLIGTLQAPTNILTALIGKLSKAVDAVRPDRQFPRKNPGKLKVGFHNAYRRTA